MWVHFWVHSLILSSVYPRNSQPRNIRQYPQGLMSHCLRSFKFSRAQQHETLSPTFATHKDPSVFPWANPSLCLSALQVNVTLFCIRLQKCLRIQQVHWAKELITLALREQKAPVWRRPIPAHTRTPELGGQVIVTHVRLNGPLHYASVNTPDPHCNGILGSATDFCLHFIQSESGRFDTI